MNIFEYYVLLLKKGHHRNLLNTDNGWNKPLLKKILDQSWASDQSISWKLNAILPLVVQMTNTPIKLDTSNPLEWDIQYSINFYINLCIEHKYDTFANSKKLLLYKISQPQDVDIKNNNLLFVNNIIKYVNKDEPLDKTNIELNINNSVLMLTLYNLGYTKIKNEKEFYLKNILTATSNEIRGKLIESSIIDINDNFNNNELELLYKLLPKEKHAYYEHIANILSKYSYNMSSTESFWLNTQNENNSFYPELSLQNIIIIISHKQDLSIASKNLVMQRLCDLLKDQSAVNELNTEYEEQLKYIYDSPYSKEILKYINPTNQLNLLFESSHLKNTFSPQEITSHWITYLLNEPKEVHLEQDMFLFSKFISINVSDEDIESASLEYVNNQRDSITLINFTKKYIPELTNILDSLSLFKDVEYDDLYKLVFTQVSNQYTKIIEPGIDFTANI